MIIVAIALMDKSVKNSHVESTIGLSFLQIQAPNNADFRRLSNHFWGRLLS